MTLNMMTLLYCTFSFLISPVVVSLQLCSTLGTTGVCAFDKLSELGPICASSNFTLKHSGF